MTVHQGAGEANNLPRDILALISRAAGMEATADSLLIELQLDPLDMAYLSMELEDHCDVSFTDAEVDSWECVADVLAAVEKARVVA